MAATCTLKYVPSVIRFIPVSKKSWILPGVLINSAASTACNNPRRSGFSTSVFSGPQSIPIRCFFVLLGLLWAAASGANPPAGNADDAVCLPDHYQEKVTVKYVIDGDTVVLTDNRHVRLIGIDTPEIGRDGQPSEAGAEPALDYLNRLLPRHKQLRLHYDRERTDHYGRTLAHLFLPDGTNLQALLLRQGLAIPLTIPPNLGFLDCYQASAEYALTRKIGLWALDQYQPRPAALLDKNDLGYRIVTGTVTRIGDSRTALWINLGKHMALRITRDDLVSFDGDIAKTYSGRRVMARGRIYFLNGEYRMRIRHPADLRIVGAHGGD